MRTDIDQKSIVPVNLIVSHGWQHPKGAVIQSADYNGFRARTPSGEPRLFLALQPGDLSVDWIDITDKAANVMVFEKTDVASRLAQKLGLLQSPVKAAMQNFAARTRELVGHGSTVDQAAMKAANELFPAEFKANGYAGVNHSMNAMLLEIDKL